MNEFTAAFLGAACGATAVLSVLFVLGWLIISTEIRTKEEEQSSTDDPDEYPFPGDIERRERMALRSSLRGRELVDHVFGSDDSSPNYGDYDSLRGPTQEKR